MWGVGRVPCSWQGQSARAPGRRGRGPDSQAFRSTRGVPALSLVASVPLEGGLSAAGGAQLARQRVSSGQGRRGGSHVRIRCRNPGQ